MIYGNPYLLCKKRVSDQNLHTWSAENIHFTVCKYSSTFSNYEVKSIAINN